MSRVERRIRALHFGRRADFRGPQCGGQAASSGPGRGPETNFGEIWSEKAAGQESLRRRAEGRREGTASTMMQSPSIANPMNSNTNASTAIS
jgi:hypothetical protein